MKEKLRDLLVERNHEAIIELTGHKRRVLSFLTALTYDPDRLVSWRAVEAIGLAAAYIADEDDPEVVRVHLRRFQWLLNDESGGIGWRFPEAMGEVVHNRPRQFAEFVPIIISLFDMEQEDVGPFRPGILWAVGRLAQVIPGVMQRALRWVVPCLDDPSPQTRGMAVWCLQQMGAAEALASRPALREDDSPVELYLAGELVYKSVGQLTEEALARSNSYG